MRKKTARIALMLSFSALLALAIVISGCSGSEAESSSGATASTARTPFVVTNPIASIAVPAPTMNKHAERNVTCAQCHDEDAPTTAPLSNRACYGCHNVETIVEATAAYDDKANKSENPHASHLYGTSCFTCHKNHSESVLYCDECHLPAFGWDVP